MNQQETVRERPILFSGPMVRAIRAGQKTQTRRAVRIDDRPITEADFRKHRLQRGIPSNAQNVRMLGGCGYLKCDSAEGSVTVSNRVPCPYGQAGDALWVRETWAVGSIYDGYSPSELGTMPRMGIRYPANGPLSGLRLRPSIHMPRWASRLTLQIVSVRVERLHEITEEDARAEGVTHWECGHPDCFGPDGTPGQHYGPRGAFRALWDSINGKRAGCAWESNPWVWVIEFPAVVPGAGDGSRL